MKKIIGKFKNFWNKGKKQKIITIAILATVIVSIAAISSLSLQEKEEVLEINFEIYKTEVHVGDTIELSYDAKSNINDVVDYNEYKRYLYYDEEIVELNDGNTNLKAIKSGKTDIYMTMVKDNKKFTSNKVTLTVKDKIVSISATYNGSTSSDVTINNYSSIKVIGTTESGETSEIDDWEVINPSKLQPEETSNFQIKYKDLTCNLSITCTTEKPMTMSQRNAYSMANRYLKNMPFSRSGLIKQLEYEGFSAEDATFAVDKCNVDWNEQAAKHAKRYLNTMSFSRSGLINQLKYEGYTQEQAEYGVSAAGY